jgi:multiple sugar transport system ATP-binding protein
VISKQCNNTQQPATSDQRQEMARVRFENVQKFFGATPAVRELTLEIREEEFFSILGPSGCGKTTTLRMVAGFELPDAGRIFFDDENVTSLLPEKRRTGMVFQNYALFPHLTVFENVAFGLRARKHPPAEISPRVVAALDLVDMRELQNRPVTQLSGGQQQRVALARALAVQPQILLLDEPLSNLDAQLRRTTRTELKNLQRRLGITTIYVTHDQVEAMTMGDKVAIMNEGRLQQFGTSEDIYFHPANVFVAGFIGSPPTNFFDCNLVKEKQYVFDCGPFRFAVPEALLEKADTWPSSLVLGIRPQDVLVHAKSPGAGAIEAVLEFDEPLGDKRILDLTIGEYQVKAQVSPDLKANVGTEFWLEFPGDKIYVFAKETGKALT